MCLAHYYDTRIIETNVDKKITESMFSNLVSFIDGLKSKINQTRELSEKMGKYNDLANVISQTKGIMLNFNDDLKEINKTIKDKTTSLTDMIEENIEILTNQPNSKNLPHFTQTAERVTFEVTDESLIPDEYKRYSLDKIKINKALTEDPNTPCLLYTSPSPRDRQKSRMPSSA